MSKPSKSSGARGQSKARPGERAQRDAGSEASNGASRKTSGSRSRAQLEQDVAELKRINAELAEQLRHERERANQLEQINEQAGERIESVIGRIKTLLAS